ncbi:MAG: organic hydroperoxide resistance protein [Acidimicrobiia bacterium]|jgi:Ohr subfamily peroxiredoxin|nr:organic hydroperoxide resistance protein [Acidimicrobiia bacterium]
MNIMYTAVAHATGDGRNGRVHSDGEALDLDLRVPKELGGPGGSFANPELLFAAGYSSCFHSALKLVSAREQADVSDSGVSATVGIGATDGGGFGLAVELDVHIPNVDDATAQRLAEAAHEVCPYSNATRGNIDVTLRVV